MRGIGDPCQRPRPKMFVMCPVHYGMRTNNLLSLRGFELATHGYMKTTSNRCVTQSRVLWLSYIKQCKPLYSDKQLIWTRLFVLLYTNILKRFESVNGHSTPELRCKQFRSIRNGLWWKCAKFGNHAMLPTRFGKKLTPLSLEAVTSQVNSRPGCRG